MKSYSTAIILLNWNNWRDTCECLASLLKSDFNDFQIVLIDNGSTDDSLEKIQAWSEGRLSISTGPFKNEPEAIKTDLLRFNCQDPEDEHALLDDRIPFLEFYHCIIAR